MQISDAQVKVVKEQLAKRALVAEIQEMDLPLETYPRPEDVDLVNQIVDKIAQMPDRQDRIDELKAKIASGTYNPSGDEIADSMIRRAIADQIR
ncbi:MAG: flagellar biosynthesis anti-sigma factor FlgM [Fimbriimonadaceae bacterium]